MAQGSESESTPSGQVQIQDGELTPSRREWLMNFPLGWTDVPVWVTRSYQPSQNKSYAKLLRSINESARKQAEKEARHDA